MNKIYRQRRRRWRMLSRTARPLGRRFWIVRNPGSLDRRTARLGQRQLTCVATTPVSMGSGSTAAGDAPDQQDDFVLRRREQGIRTPISGRRTPARVSRLKARLPERMRAGGAGIPAFFTKTGVGTIVAEGKERARVRWREVHHGTRAFAPTFRWSRPGRPTNRAISSIARRRATSIPVVAIAARSPWPKSNRGRKRHARSDLVHTPGIFVSASQPPDEVARRLAIDEIACLSLPGLDQRNVGANAAFHDVLLAIELAPRPCPRRRWCQRRFW